MAKFYWTESMEQDVIALYERYKQQSNICWPRIQAEFNKKYRLSLSDSCIRAKYRRLIADDSILKAKHKAIETDALKGITHTSDMYEVKEFFNRVLNGEDENLEAASFSLNTIDKLLDYAEIDKRLWTVKRSTISSREVQYEEFDEDGEVVVKTRPLFRISASLQSIHSPFITAVIPELFEDFENFKPYTPKPKVKKNKENFMLEISLHDFHFAQLCLQEEVGMEANLESSIKVFANAVYDALNKVKGINISKILFPIGSDFFHVDSWQGTTTKGTQVDTSSRFPRVYKAGCRSLISAINACLEVAPVELIWVPGNHDKATSLYLSEHLAAWYRNVKEVTIDTSNLSPRKYTRWGPALIGFAHGDIKTDRLPTVMAAEAKKDWALCNQYHFHIGHTHKKKQTRYVAEDTHEGVVVTVIPSMCATDYWHHYNGFIKTVRAGEVYLWSDQTGKAGCFSIYARE